MATKRTNRPSPAPAPAKAASAKAASAKTPSAKAASRRPRREGREREDPEREGREREGREREGREPKGGRRHARESEGREPGSRPTRGRGQAHGHAVGARRGPGPRHTPCHPPSRDPPGRHTPSRRVTHRPHGIDRPDHERRCGERHEPRPPPAAPSTLISPAVATAYHLPAGAEPEDDGGALGELLGIAEAPLDTFDPAGFGRSLIDTGRAAVRNPRDMAVAVGKFGIGATGATFAAAGRAIGRDYAGPLQPAPKDHRFADPAWRENAAYFYAQQLYLLAQQFALDTVEAAHLDPAEEQKARFAAQFVIDALAPTNTFPGNPAALRAAFETGGRSVVRGARNMLRDLRTNGGWPSQVDDSGFGVGRNMAMTPGKVVYRNGLIELLEYTPQTDDVYEIPLLFCPPWINKYYIMDLAPGKSLIEWAVRHGHRCFAISYRNPDSSMRDIDFDDYLLGGPIDALRVVRAITGQPEVNTVSVCLGGQLTAIAMAYGAAIGDQPVHTATLINTHTDYTHPGSLGAFTDEESVARLEKRMAKKGYLEASDMAKTFDALRANDLIFNYVVNNWLLGKNPPAFDLLAWNADSTRMPAKMHSRYLRSCYLRNEFANGEFVADGVQVDPAAVLQETYVLSAVDDHIVPWISAYKTTHLLGGPSTFVLSTSGHIAGIVNPPSPKAKHWTNEAHPTDPQLWLRDATLHDETWWANWVRWIATRAGDVVRAPREHGSAAFPVLGDAPGSYVRGRAR